MANADKRQLRVHPTTHGRSKTLRCNATHPEQVLWHALRNRQVADLKFRRQHPVGRFIVDFACLRPKLAIEIDGESHTGRQKADARRQAFIEADGFVVLRFSNDEVLENLEGVLEVIARVATGGVHPPLAPP